jgi:hypothetical protein
MVACGGTSRVLFFPSVDSEEGEGFVLIRFGKVDSRRLAKERRIRQGLGMTLASLPRRSGQAEGRCEASDLCGLSIPFVLGVWARHSLP